MDNAATETRFKAQAKRIQLLEAHCEAMDGFCRGLYDGEVFFIDLLKRHLLATTGTNGTTLQDVVMVGPANEPRVLPTGVEPTAKHNLAVSLLTDDALDRYTFRVSALRETARLAAERKAKKLSGPNGPTSGVFGNKAGGGGAPPANQPPTL